jgi:LacI family transcriptional regulator
MDTPLVTGKPRVVLLMHPFAGYDRGLLEGIARYAQIHEPWVFCLAAEYPEVPTLDSDSITGKMFHIRPAKRGVRKTGFALGRLGAAGVIGRIQTPAMVRALLSSRLPAIAVDLTEKQLSEGSPLADISEIRADSHNAGRIAAEHLLERGFASFGFCGYQGRIWSDRREKGFCERLELNQCSCDVYQLARLAKALPWRREQPLVTAWLRSLPKPVGIMACNDVRGRQVIEACLEAGLKVPDDVGVVGVDEDRLLCDLANPPLSSVVFNLERAGYQAAELLDGMMSGRVREPQRIMVEARWVIGRRSTDVVAAEDPHVASALRFIRDHFRQAITASDVVADARISRRSLEIRFQRAQKRSIREEIQHARLAWCKKLLVETNLSAEKIADASGFSSVSYMSDVFRRELGFAPAQYRRESRTPQF